MKNIIEPNTRNIKRGDFVIVELPHAARLSQEEINKNFLHSGEVIRVYHNDKGFLKIEVSGLKERAGFGRAFSHQIVSVSPRPTIFGTDEPYIEVNTFSIKSAAGRYSARNFRGDIANIGDGEFEIYSYDSGNSYVVKVEALKKHDFNVGCTCPDFTNRTRVCKHIVAFKIAA
jgi:hypothetical protein